MNNEKIEISTAYGKFVSPVNVENVKYKDCALALLKMWVEKVITDEQYLHILDKLTDWYMRQPGKDV